MQYLVVVNSLEMDPYKLEGEEIIDLLFKNGIWLFSERAPFVKEMKTGDKFIVYTAGLKQRYFNASFELVESPIEHKLSSNDKKLDILYQMLPFSCRIGHAKKWKDPVKIIDILDKLEVISDKQNWGLNLRQSVRLLSKNDYSLIMSRAKD